MCRPRGRWCPVRSPWTGHRCGERLGGCSRIERRRDYDGRSVCFEPPVFLWWAGPFPVGVDAGAAHGGAWAGSVAAGRGTRVRTARRSLRRQASVSERGEADGRYWPQKTCLTSLVGLGWGSGAGFQDRFAAGHVAGRGDGELINTLAATRLGWPAMPSCRRRWPAHHVGMWQ